MKLILICLMLSTGLILTLLSCSDDSPTGSSHKISVAESDYHIIYGYAGTGIPLTNMIYSSKTGELIDSTNLDQFVYTDIHFTSDGSKLIYMGYQFHDSRNRVVRIQDYNTGEVTNEVSAGITQRIDISPDNQFLACYRGQNISLYTLPDLNLLFDTLIDNHYGRLLPDRREFVYIIRYTDSLYILDFSDLENIHISAKHLTYDGQSVSPDLIEVSLTRDKIIIFDGHPEPKIHSIDAKSKLIETAVEGKGIYSGIKTDPSGRFVYLFEYYAIATDRIDRIDLVSNSLENFLKYDDAIWPDGLAPGQLEFTPDGERLYILNGTDPFHAGYHSLIGINLSDKSLIHILRPNNGYSEVVAINPRNFGLK